MREGNDPRLDPGTDDAAMMNSPQPMVGAPARRSSAFTIAATFAVLAIALFVFLNSRRDAQGSTSIVTPAEAMTAAEPAPPPPLQLGPPPAAPAAPPASSPAKLVAPPAPPLPVIEAKPVVAAPDPLQRRRAPSLVVDLGTSGEFGNAVSSLVAAGAGVPQAAVVTAQGQSPLAAAAASGAASPGAAPVTPGGSGLALAAIAANTLSAPALAPGGGVEQFARRTEEDEPGQARATELPNLGFLVAQGTVIPGVLETAIDSDLPGFTRAVVSRDVRNFEGTAVLIPRGSRLIGQYKSAVALGQTRAFIIWTRIIRPDGASILIGSPGGDALGRGGLDGKVDTHFFERFGGSILLSVLNAGVAAIAGVPATQVTIGSPGAAIGAASSIVNGDSIPPTIKVPQGATIRIFVARDLDFSAVGPAK